MAEAQDLALVLRGCGRLSADACEELWWGKRLAAVRLRVDRAEEDLAGELLADAWEQKAPKGLLKDRTGDSG